MKHLKSLTPAIALGVLSLTAPNANAQGVISYFNFNALIAGSVTVTAITPNAGNGSLSTTFPTGVANVTAFGGSTVNAENSDPAGQSLALLGGASNVNNGSSLTLKLFTTSYSGLTLSYATQKTGTGFNSDQLSYSTDGTTFTDLGSAYNPPTSFALQSFSLPSLLDNQDNVYLRITFSGATSASGNNRIDNLKVTAATPAPSSLMVALVGVPGIGLLIRRRKTAK